MPISKRTLTLIKRIVWITGIALVIHVIFPRNLFLDMTKFNFSGYNDTSYIFSINISEFLNLIEKNKYSIKGGNIRVDRIRKILCAIQMTPQKNVSKSHEYRRFFSGRDSYYTIRFDIDSISPNKTQITYNILESDYQILCGKEFYINLHQILDFSDRWVKKKPSSIEIYEVLRYIGKIVGEKNMLPIHYPKCFSKNQILKTFCNDNPFTTQELFGEPQPESEKDPIYTEKELKKRKRKGSPPIKFDYHYCK